MSTKEKEAVVKMEILDMNCEYGKDRKLESLSRLIAHKIAERIQTASH